MRATAWARCALLLGFLRGFLGVPSSGDPAAPGCHPPIASGVVGAGTWGGGQHILCPRDGEGHKVLLPISGFLGAPRSWPPRSSCLPAPPACLPPITPPCSSPPLPAPPLPSRSSLAPPSSSPLLPRPSPLLPAPLCSSPLLPAPPCSSPLLPCSSPLLPELLPAPPCSSPCTSCLPHSNPEFPTFPQELSRPGTSTSLLLSNPI